MRNVLIIVLASPPIGGVPVQCVVKFVKYLSSFGWNPIILTVKKYWHTKFLCQWTLLYTQIYVKILALVSQDCDCAQIVKTTQSGVVVDPGNHQKAKAVILDMYEKYRKGQLTLGSNDKLIQQYERKTLTGKLAAIFDDLLSERQEL